MTVAHQAHSFPRALAGTGPAPSAGFSLPELLLVAALLGILASIALPSGQGALARMRVEAASRSLMLEIDRQRDRALRQGHSVVLHLGGGDGLLEQTAAAHGGVEVHHNLPGALRFSANGLLIDGGTVVVTSPATPLRRCLVWSLPLGVLRLGQYGADPAAGPSSGHCQAD